jgi:ABC-2 type transport system ATP-binding protein
MSAAIEFQRASRWYGPVIALNDVSARVEPGVLGLLGPNGAGKSTFLKLAAGQLAPSQGEVRLLGCRPGDRRRCSTASGCARRRTRSGRA